MPPKCVLKLGISKLENATSDLKSWSKYLLYKQMKLMSTFPNSVSVSEVLAVISLYFCGMYDKSNIVSTSSDTMQAEEHESTKIVVFIVFLPFLNCSVILGKFGSI